MEQLTLENMSFTYPNSREKALDSVSFSLKKGEFVVLCGRSGSGKSTLLSRLKPTEALQGTEEGAIYFDGQPLSALSTRESASRIGFVRQSPETALVTDKVWHELAFGLESLGVGSEEIRRRVAETASYFGIGSFFHAQTDELSGGQKQLVNLASVMVMQPELLLLDEPTSRLDPIAAADFFAVLSKINRELGITVLLSEHRAEEALPLADRVAVLEHGKLLCIDTPTQTGKLLKAQNSRMFYAMPTAMRVWASTDSTLDCPVTAAQGKGFLDALGTQEKNAAKPLCATCSLCGAKSADSITEALKNVVLSASEVFFRYEKDSPDVLRDFSLSLGAGEIVSILGGNGAGKSTALRVLSGREKPYRGSVSHTERVGLLPQDVRSLFVKKSLREELFETLSKENCTREEKEKRIQRVAELCELSSLFERHPFDLSGGEQQRAALAKLLLLSPKILLLDEPTKGLDAYFKRDLLRLLRKLSRQGTAILTVSHDMDFCAELSDRCLLFFDGAIASWGTPTEFFGKNSFYTTAANRMARHIDERVVTVADAIALAGGKAEDDAEFEEKNEAFAESPMELLPNDRRSDERRERKDCKASDRQIHSATADKTEKLATDESAKRSSRTDKVCRFKKLGGALCALTAGGLFFYAASVHDLSTTIGKNGVSLTGEQVGFYLVFFAALAGAMLLLGTSEKRPEFEIQVHKGKRRLTRRTRLAVAAAFLCVPLTLFIAVAYVDRHSYNLMSFLVLAECILPFCLSFEGRKPSARELTVIASLCAIGVAGRAAFFMLPQFKPVLAVTIVAGVCLGGETGFLVGATTMLVSNVLFSQGPWTMWQMFAMGLCGLLAGVLFRKGLLRRTRGALSAFGAFAAIVVYGGIMNPASALLWGGGQLSVKVLAAYYVSGFPMDCVHAFATAFFLWTCGEAMAEKLERIKTKYGF